MNASGVTRPNGGRKLPELTEEEIEQLRALLPQATPEEASEIIEEAAEIIEEETKEPEPDEELIEEAAEVIEEAQEIVEEEIEPISENPESGPESDSEYGGTSADNASGEFDVSPIYANVDGADAVPATASHADVSPRSSHWFYRPLRRR